MKTSVYIKNVNNLHKELGHPIKATTRATGMSRRIKVVGNLNLMKLASWEKQSKDL